MKVKSESEGAQSCPTPGACHPSYRKGPATALGSCYPGEGGTLFFWAKCYRLYRLWKSVLWPAMFVR